MSMTQRERETLSYCFTQIPNDMSYQELKTALRELGLPTTGNTSELQARYDAAIAAASNNNAANAADAAGDAADAVNESPEKVIVNGVELTPYTPDAQPLREYVAARRQREFPQLLAAVPNGNYETTGRFSLYPWTSVNRDGEEVATTLMVVEITDGEHFYFVGEWEFVSRTYGFTPAGGELQHPHWVLDTLATGSLRTQAILAMPAGTACVKHSEIGRLTDKPGTRNYLCHWIARD